MQRRNAEPTFVDFATAELGSERMTRFFELCDAHIPWAALAQRMADLFDDTPGKPGRPHWPVPMMLKIVMLKKWFGLSDPQAEDAIKDRLSFRRFLGLSLHDRSPDHSTIRLFTQRLRESGHVSTLFDAVIAHLTDKGVIIMDGSIVDATIMQAPRGSKREDGTSTRDPGGTTTSKHNRAYFGFRAHVRADKRGVLLDYRYDTARESEHTYIDDLLSDERKEAYADSGYMKKERSRALQDRGVFPGIMHRRVRGQAELTPEQVEHNRACAKVRAMVEHAFGWLRLMGHRVRYRGVQNNGADFGLAAAAYNLKRMFSLLGLPLTTPARPA